MSERAAHAAAPQRTGVSGFCSRAKPRASTRLLQAWLGAGLIAGLLLWVWAHGKTTPERAAPTANAVHAPVPAARERARPAQTRALLRTLGELARAAEESAPAQPASDETPDRTPHPLTPDHERLYRDVDLLHAADQAIEAGRFAEARALLAQHHRELPGMSVVEEEGLWLLTDCAELRSAANVSRVQAFYDQHSASTVRRRLRRACLESTP